jgi:hypothetical protein
LTADVVLNGAILAIGDDSLSGNLGIGLMLINELRQFMRLIDPAGRGPNRRNDSLGVIDHPVVFLPWPSFESMPAGSTSI